MDLGREWHVSGLKALIIHEFSKRQYLGTCQKAGLNAFSNKLKMKGPKYFKENKDEATAFSKAEVTP